MTGQVGLVQIREEIDRALRLLRPFSPSPQNDHFQEWCHAITMLENASLALYVRTVAPTAVEILDVKTVQDLDVATARRIEP